MNKISQVEVVDGARDFRLMRRHMVDAILSVSEYNRFSKGILPGLDSRQNTCHMRMLRGSLVKLVGLSGNCFLILLKESSIFQIHL